MMAVAVEDVEGRNADTANNVVSCYKEICTRTSWADASVALIHIAKVMKSRSKYILVYIYIRVLGITFYLCLRVVFS